MRLTLNIWRQKDAGMRRQACRRYPVEDVNPDMSILEVLDVLNEELIGEGRGAHRLRARLPRGHLRLLRFHDQRDCAWPAAGDHRLPVDYAAFQRRRGIDTGAVAGTAFPLIKDLVVDRRAFDRIIAAGGYISVATGSAPDGNTIPVPKEAADRLWTPPPASAAARALRPARTPPRRCSRARKSLISGTLPQGKPERDLARHSHGGANERGGFRRLHEHRRMYRRLPESRFRSK